MDKLLTIKDSESYKRKREWFADLYGDVEFPSYAEVHRWIAELDAQYLHPQTRQPAWCRCPGPCYLHQRNEGAPGD